MEAWFARFVVQDRDGRDYEITGKGQLRPVGGTWEDGSQSFAQE